MAEAEKLQSLGEPKSPIASSNNASASRQALRAIRAIATPEGSGATVWRTIGGSELETLDPFLMLDHFIADHDGAAFPDHPHRGQATVTYMLQGSSRHEDSVGNLGTLRAGDVQWMVAGRGVKHAEMPIYEEGLDVPVGLQLWVNLPSQSKMVAPAYKDLKAESIPTVFLDQGDIEIRVIGGTSCNVSVPIPPIGGCWYFHMKFHKSRSGFRQDLPPSWTSFLYIITGSLSVDQSEAFPELTAVVLSSETGENHVFLCAEEDNTEIILLAAEPLNQPVARFGPFVMNTKEELQKALLDYRMEINGFENARRWKSSIGGR